MKIRMKAAALLLTCMMLLPLMPFGGAEKLNESGQKDAQGSTVFGSLGIAWPADKVLQDWSIYDKLIDEIRSEQDPQKRIILMHKAEDILMDTGAICPFFSWNGRGYYWKTPLKGFYFPPLIGPIFTHTTGTADGILRVRQHPFSTLDPDLLEDVSQRSILLHLFAGLYEIDENNCLKPDLAQKSEVSKDGLTWTFTLKPDLKWSNGDKLDANDFVYAWERGIDKTIGNPYSSLFSSIEGFPDRLNIKASEDGQTLTVKLVRPCPFFLTLTAMPAFVPLPQKVIEAAEQQSGDPFAWTETGTMVTNGPFKLKSWEPNVLLDMVRNENYHRAKEVALNELIVHCEAVDSSFYQKYIDGEYDFIEFRGQADYPQLPPYKEYHSVPWALGVVYLSFNINNQEIFGKMTPQEAKTLRQALCLLIDRKALTAAAMGSEDAASSTLIPPGVSDGNGNGGQFRSNSEDYRYPIQDSPGYYPLKSDFTRAKELLQSLGYRFTDEGKLSPETPLHLKFTALEVAKDFFPNVVEQFESYGISCETEYCNFETYMKQRQEGDFMITLSQWGMDYNDPLNLLESYTSSDSTHNECGFGR